MNKRIGIITYHNAINYGAVLQSYALQNYICSFCDDVEIINYQCPAIEIQYCIKGIGKSYSILNFFAHNLTCIVRYTKKKRFRFFCHNYLRLSEQKKRNDLFEMDYSILITGSDQVFNPKCNGNDSSFFLDFSQKAKKYSYAASLGSVMQFRTSSFDSIALLNQFSAISLREQESVDYLRNKVGIEVFQSVDPVWLLKKEQWERIIPKRNRSPYILIYNMLDFKKMKDYAAKVSKATKLPLISISRTIMGDIMYSGCSRIKSNCSPQDFLSLISGSSLFITDSFHGTSFAIILEKKFGVFLNEKKDNTNSRIENLLSITGLSKCVIQNDGAVIDDDIDFKTAKEKINKLIVASQRYLKTVIADR